MTMSSISGAMSDKTPPPTTAESHAAVLKLLASTDRPPTYKLTPPSSLLSRIQNFLPEIAAANKKLESVPQNERDIECVEEGMRHIEMNVQVVEENEMQSESESESESGEIVVLDDNKDVVEGMIVDTEYVER